MRGLWIVASMAALLTTAALVSTGSQSASAQVTPIAQPESHELCGIGLGGRCPRRYRSCRRTQPQAVCDERNVRCEACSQAMFECRQQVGHVAGVTCEQCREAFARCEAALSVCPN
jgi:hypothetical protein